MSEQLTSMSALLHLCYPHHQSNGPCCQMGTQALWQYCWDCENPGDRVLLACSFEWHCQGPREQNDTYETCINDNRPNCVGSAWEAKDRILRHVIVRGIPMPHPNHPHWKEQEQTLNRPSDLRSSRSRSWVSRRNWSRYRQPLASSPSEMLEVDQ